MLGLFRARDNMNTRVAGGVDQFVGKGVTKIIPPARAFRSRSDNMRKMVGAGIVGNGRCNVLSGNGNRRGAQSLREAESLGNPVTVGFACTRIGRCFNMDRGPLRAQSIGHAFGMTYDCIGAACGIDQNKHALACGP